MSIATASGFEPFVPRLAARWDTAAPGERARVLDASLLGLDISGFTALSERLQEKGKLGAEELILLISRCYSGLIDIAQRYGGDVLKFRGDALLLVFEGDGHESRAACAALAMQRFIAAGGAAGESSVGPVELSMCAGLVSGECHFFLLGRHHRELIVCGPTASATLELEDAAESGEVLASARTAEALEGFVASERDGAFLLRPEAGDAELPPLPDEPAAAADGLSELVPPALRVPIEEGAVEAEHRRVTAAFVKYSGTDELVERIDEADRVARPARRRRLGRDRGAARHVARVGHRPQRRQALSRRRRARERGRRGGADGPRAPRGRRRGRRPADLRRRQPRPAFSPARSAPTSGGRTP